MPRPLTQYSVFIGSPGGLDEERQSFRDILRRFNENHGQPDGVRFEPIGWEDTLPGVGRPQELINEDLRNCDYAVFVLHDHWGTPTGNGSTSGTEEEWQLAQSLYAANTIRNICLFFKDVDASKLRDPGQQLLKVIRFKNRIKDEKKHLFKCYANQSTFVETLEKYLGKWLRDHRGEGASSASWATLSSERSEAANLNIQEPSFQYWLNTSQNLREAVEAGSGDAQALFFCTDQAVKAANSDLELVKAQNAKGIAHFYLNDHAAAIAVFDNIINHLDAASNPSLRKQVAVALFNKGIALRKLGRSEDSIALFGDIVDRFGTSSDTQLLETVACALVEKGSVLGSTEEAIKVYDDVNRRFDKAPQAEFREQVAAALVKKAITLGHLGRRDKEFASYDDVLVRFEADPAPAVRAWAARALFNKGVSLAALGKIDLEIAVYDDVDRRFRNAHELSLREVVANALANKATRLLKLARIDEAIAAIDDLLDRFESAPDASLRKQAATTLFNKGYAYYELGRYAEAIASYDDLVRRFETASENELRELVAAALCNKGRDLGLLGLKEEAIEVYDDVAARFGPRSKAPVIAIAIQALVNKAKLLRGNESKETSSVRTLVYLHCPKRRPAQSLIWAAQWGRQAPPLRSIPTNFWTGLTIANFAGLNRSRIAARLIGCRARAPILGSPKRSAMRPSLATLFLRNAIAGLRLDRKVVPSLRMEIFPARNNRANSRN